MYFISIRVSPGIRVPREYFSDLKKKLVPTLKTKIIGRRRLFISLIFMHPDDAYLGSRLIKDPVILFLFLRSRDYMYQIKQ